MLTASTFIAIDFETADPGRDSACAIGLVRVEAGAIVRRVAALVRPPRGMSPQCQAVHGLSYADVADAPPFARVWQTLAPVLDGIGTLVAHNVAFDRSVLDACCKAANLRPPACAWVCTLELARRMWPKPASNKLPDVCARLGIALERHHEAGADAGACARVLLALAGHPPAAPTWTPTTAAGTILAAIPAAHRTAAVVALMRDAEALGPAHAADLVRRVGRWFRREEPGRPRCRCGARRSLLCDLCPTCVRAEDPP